MNPFTELLASDHDQTLRFFYSNITEVIEPEYRTDLPTREIMYAASVLAHFAQVSTATTTAGENPTPADWVSVHDRYLKSTQSVGDPQLMERFGAETLLFLGFFPALIERRHQFNYCLKLGREFYSRAATIDQPGRWEVMIGMHRRFELWVMHFQMLDRHFQENRFLLSFNSNPSPPLA